MEFFWTYVAPTLGVILSVMAPVLGGLAVTVLVKLLSKIGYDIEAKNRDAFQTSITNAAKMAASKMGGPLAANTVTNVVLTEATNMVLKSVPDAVKKFNAKPEDIAPRIKAQAELILQSAETVVPEIVSSTILSKIRKTG